MSEVPASYLHYLWNHGLKYETKTSDVAKYIETSKSVLESENPDLIWD
jgi:hypothetical protein